MEQFDRVKQIAQIVHHEPVVVEAKEISHLDSAPWAGIWLASALLRLINLGAAPLSPAEVNEALAALASYAEPGAAGASSGLLVGANSFIFWLLGASDVSARLLPALVGSLLPLTMMLFTRKLGRRGALFAAGLLALSPSLTLFSRSSSGVILGVTSALVLAGTLLRYLDGKIRDQRFLLAAGAALGFGLASGGTFVGLALTLFLASWVARSAELIGAWRQVVSRRPLLLAAGVLIASSTIFFFFPAGLGVTADGLTEWLAGFKLGWAGRLLGILAIYELFILLFGLPGIVLTLWRGDKQAKALVYWALLGLALALLRPNQPDAPFLFLIPLALSAGIFLNALWNRETESHTQRIAAAAIIILGAHIFISLGQYAYYVPSNPSRATASLLLAGISVILVFGIVALTWTYSRTSALRSLTMALLVLLSIFSWGKAWELGQTHQSDPRQLWVREATAPGARILVETLETSSERNTRDSHTLPLTVQSGDPLLQWYLRDFTNVTWVDALQAAVISEAVIAPVEQQDPLLGDNYTGMDLDLRLKSPVMTDRSVAAGLRWLLLRNPAAGGSPTATSRVVLWIRQDITLTSDQN